MAAVEAPTVRPPEQPVGPTRSAASPRRRIGHASELASRPARPRLLASCRLLYPLAGLIALLVLLAAASVASHFWPHLGWHLVATQLLLLGAAIALLWLTVYRVRQQLVAPLHDLREWSQRIRAGDLTTHIPLPARGEFHDLVRDVNNLTDELNELTEEMDTKVREQTEHIANKTRSLEILYDIATSLSTARNLDELLDQFLDTLMILVDAKAASVRMLTGDNQTRLVASRGLSEDVIEQERQVDVNRCLCGTIALQGGLGIQKGLDGCNRYLTCGPMVEGTCVEVVVVPLQYQERILGVYNLFLSRPSSELGKDARDLLNSIGKHLGLALEKARLDENARRLAIMEERNIIGSELHDSLAQSLVSMRLQVKLLGEILHRRDIRSAQNEVRQLRSAIEEAHSSLRELLANYRSRMDERGLLFAVEDLVERFKEDSGINTFLQNECQALEINLSPEQEIQVFRIIQEALANVRKHSNSCNVRIRLSETKDGQCSILVEDDGLGIDSLPEGDRPGEHVGLDIMQERAARLHGELSIDSEPGEGTRVYLTFPLMSPRQHDQEDQPFARSAH